MIKVMAILYETQRKEIFHIGRDILKFIDVNILYIMVFPLAMRATNVIKFA